MMRIVRLYLILAIDVYNNLSVSENYRRCFHSKHV